MTERNPVNTGASSEGVATERTLEQAAWESVFVAVTDLAKLRKRRVNEFALLGTIKAEPDETADYKLRVNPALVTDNGELEVIVVDVTYMGKPSQ